MKILYLITALFFFNVSAHADPALVTDEGFITISGKVEAVSPTKDGFTLLHGQNKINVSMDQIDDEVLNQLIDSGIIQTDSYVSVVGEMDDDVSGPVIKASTISIDSNNNY